MPNLNAQIVSNIPISLPSEQELENLVQILEAINKAISLTLENIEKLKRLKKNLLDALL
jgi:restriction endonuclease S subunit